MLKTIQALITKVSSKADSSALVNLVNTSIQSVKMAINTTVDSVNKLAVKSNNILFTADSTNNGSIRTVINKDSATDVANIQFKDNFSLKAELGLNGSDDYSLKVSQDGSTFVESYKVANSDGSIDFKVNAQKKGIDLATIDQINLTVTNVISVSQLKPTLDGTYVFKVVPTDGLPAGIAVGDIAKLSNGVWSLLFSNFNAPNLINSGLNKYAFFKENGTYISLTERLGAVPIGTIFHHLGYSAPTNYVLLNGTSLSKSVYADLWTFAVNNSLTTTNASLKTKFIDVDTATFKVPDLRGYFLRGLDNSGSIDIDGALRGIGDIQVDALKSHTHPRNSNNRNELANVYPNVGTSGVSSSYAAGNQTDYYTNTGASGGSETRPINASVNYIIKALNSISGQQIVAGKGMSLNQDTSGNIVLNNSGVTPPGYLYGLTTSPNSVSPNTKIDIFPGRCRDLTDMFDLSISSTFTKDISSTWAAGTNNGGRAPSVSLNNGSWYHLFIIYNGSTIDFYFDSSLSAANIPNGFTSYRRIWSVYYFSGIKSYTQFSNKCVWSSFSPDSYTPTTTASLISVLTPLGLSSLVKLAISLPDAGSGTYGVAGLFSSPLQADITPTFSTANILAQRVNGSFSSNQAVELEILTDTNSKIRSRFNSVSTNYSIHTLGYEDISLGVVQSTTQPLSIFSNQNPVTYSYLSSTSISFNSGNFNKADGTGQVSLASMSKLLASTWASGSNSSGLDVGSVQPNKWYFIYAIYNPALGLTDIIFSLNNSSPALPLGYSQFTRLPGALKTNSSSQIIQFTISGRTTYFTNAILVFSAVSSTTTSVVSNALPAIPCEAILNQSMATTQAGYSSQTVWGSNQTGSEDASSTIGTNNGFKTSGNATVFSSDGTISWRNFQFTGGVNGASGYLLSFKDIQLDSTIAGTNQGITGVNSANGYVNLPNGLILQWGMISGITAADGSASVTFSIPFPNNVFNITTSHIISAASGSIISSCSIQSGYTKTGFTLIQDTFGTNAINEMWFAIGA